MVDERFVEALARSLAAKLLPQIQNSNGKLFPRLMNTRQCAEYLSRSVNSIRHLRFRRKIPIVKIDRRIAYDRVAIDKWIVGNRRQANRRKTGVVECSRKKERTK